VRERLRVVFSRPTPNLDRLGPDVRAAVAAAAYSRPDISSLRGDRFMTYRMYCRGSLLPIEHHEILILQRTSNAEIEVCFAIEIRP
jgi:hypothetical protein